MTREVPLSSWVDQNGFALRFDWGPNGLRALGPVADVVVVIDVFRFTTCVDVACARGATVLPYRWHDGSEIDFARAQRAELAGYREDDDTPWSLSPAALATIPAGTRLVLPSPNGSALAQSAASDHGAAVLAGCLRNAGAVGRAAVELADGGVVAVIAAGERWRGAVGPLRPSVEDLWGAGAVLAAASEALGAPDASPEARAAVAAYEPGDRCGAALADSVGGRELSARGWSDDLEMCLAVDVSECVPVLCGDGFVARDRSS